jgi:hypothetical protein
MNLRLRPAPGLHGALTLAFVLLAPAPFGAAQDVKPETDRGFDCYVQTAESRMDARPHFLFAESDTALQEKLVRGRQIVTLAGGGANPHKVAGGHVNDWVGSVFIPGATVARVVSMLQDYDHRAMYFSDIMSISKLLCRTEPGRFQFSMLLKEPSVIESENDVVWEKLDEQRWKCRSYSTKMKEIGKQHRYLLRLNSYWRFKEVPEGVYVQGQNLTLGGEVGAFTRSLGSMIGLSPEKSLRKTLTIIRDTVMRKDVQFFPPPAQAKGCGAATPRPGCAGVTSN